MSKIDSLKSELLPNTYPTPNWIIDQGIWALLNDKERTLYPIVVRKTLGWWKRTDRISKTQLIELSGLSPATVTSAMKNLVAFGLVVRVSENNQDNEGIEWGYQPDHSKVNVKTLLERFEKKSKINRERAQKMRERGGVLSDIPPMSDNDGGGLSDNVHKTNKTKRSGSGEPSIEAEKIAFVEAFKREPKTETELKYWLKVHPDFKPLYEAFVIHFKRAPIKDSEWKFWLFGSGANHGGAKGIKDYLKIGIQPKHIEQAFTYCKNKRMTVSNPNSLFPFADMIYRDSLSENLEDETTARERIQSKIRSAKNE